MGKENLRQKYIDIIMKNKYGSDDPKYDSQNLAFLESLQLEELARLADGECDFGDDEFELGGEVDDIDDLDYTNTEIYGEM